MTRNLKALGLALAAVLVISALSVASAQAVPTFTGYETTPGNPHVHTTLEGTTDPGVVEKFQTGVGTKECHNTYSGTDLTGDNSTATVTVTDWKTPNTSAGKHCVTTAFGSEFKTDIEFTSCDYLFHVESKLKEDEYTGTVDVKCTTPGDHIHIKVTNASGGVKCLTTVPEQTGLKHVIFHNKKETKPTKVTVTANVTEITYTQTEGGLLGCGRKDGTYTDATYTGQATVAGANTAGQQIDVEVSGQ